MNLLKIIFLFIGLVGLIFWTKYCWKAYSNDLELSKNIFKCRYPKDGT